MKTKSKLRARPRILTESRSGDQEATIDLKLIIGSGLVIMSGLLLYLDKILDATGFASIEVSSYVDFQTFIWHWGQNFSPLLLIVAFIIGFKKITLIVPITAYAIQTRWLISDLSDEMGLVGLYAAAVILTVALVSIAIFHFLKNNEKIVKNLLNHSMTARRSYVDMAVKATDGTCEESEIIEDLQIYDSKFKKAISEVEELI